MGKLAIQAPVMIHFGEEPWDEVYITEDAANAGIEIVNTGGEPLVALRYFWLFFRAASFVPLSPAAGEPPCFLDQVRFGSSYSAPHGQTSFPRASQRPSPSRKAHSACV